MRYISPDMMNAFKDGNRATLLKITCKDGTVYGYTDYDDNLTTQGVTYVPAPGLTRPTLTATSNDQVSNQEFASAWVDAPEELLMSGKFDNAEVEIAYCDPYNVWNAPYVFDKGNIGVLQWTADGFRADMQSHMRNLTRNLNFVYTAGCRHRLFSQFSPILIGACTLNSMSYTFTGTVTDVNISQTTFTVAGLAQPNGMCNGGVLVWTSGLNKGLSNEVKTQTGGIIDLKLRAFQPISSGDTFTVTAGCDKTFDTCKSKYDNGINFGGFPHIQSEVQYR